MSHSPHNLERFLQSQESQGTQVDTGEFTMHREKALQKIAEFGSPFQYSWAVLIGRAATLLNGDELNIYQESKETYFSFIPESWEEFDFERYFFEPGAVENSGVQALRQALWFAGVGEGRPFQVTFPDSVDSFVWDGQKMTKLPSVARRGISVTISHRTLKQGKGIPILRSIQAAFHNSAVQDAVREFLYPAPLRVRLDSREVSGWGYKPKFGFETHGNPIRVLGLDTSLPRMNPPPALRPSYSGQNAKLEPLSSGVDLHSVNKPFSVVVMLTGFGGLYSNGKNSSWRTESVASELLWVKDGTVVQRELVDLPHRSVAVSVHLCADGLPTDFSGFALQEDAVAAHRDEALKAVARALLLEEPHFRVYDPGWYKGKKVLAAAAVVGGIGLKVLAGPAGIPFLVGGMISGITVMQSHESVCHKFESDFAKLQEDWQKKFLSS